MSEKTIYFVLIIAFIAIAGTCFYLDLRYVSVKDLKKSEVRIIDEIKGTQALISSCGYNNTWKGNTYIGYKNTPSQSRTDTPE